MGLTARVLKLERATHLADAEVVGVVNEHDLAGDTPDAVTVWPGGERMGVTAFESRFPGAMLVVRRSFSRPASDEESAGGGRQARHAPSGDP